MEVLLHTIALEPARWTPKKVSQSLPGLIPGIARTGFRQIEVFEPHLRDEGEFSEIRGALQGEGLAPVILSSYINIAALTPEEFELAVAGIEMRLAFFGFGQIRLFPGPKIDPSDEAAVEVFAKRLAVLVKRWPETGILLETHDHSIADDPEVLVEVVKSLAAPHVGLLYQPTIFQEAPAVKQFAVQKEWIRHVHLQNRDPQGGFSPLKEGVVPWPQLLRDLPAEVDVSIEFVPKGICSEDAFDLVAVLAQVAEEKAFVERTLAQSHV